MTTPLFRKEVLEHRKDRLQGDILLSQPVSLRVLVWVVAGVVLFLFALLGWGTYARKETVRGFVTPDKGVVKAYAAQVGVISAVHIREGESVEEGAPLVTLLSERALAGGSDIDSVQLRELEAMQAHWHDRIKGEQQLFSSEQSRLRTQIRGIGLELKQLEQSVCAQEERIALLQKRVEASERLWKARHVSEQEYQKLREEWLSQKQRYQELLRERTHQENTLQQTHVELEQLPIRVHSRLADMENTLSELKQRQAEIAGRRTLEIRAPMSGTVTALQARVGQWQVSNTPLLAILPKTAVFQAELYVPSRAIGFITPHQKVKIRLDAFPYQRFGIYEGEVAVISKHALLPAELPNLLVDLKEPVYRVTVHLGQQQVRAYGKQFPLQAGMSLEADIILEKQTLLQWIFDPLFSLKGRI